MTTDKIGLYLHIPFCVSKCKYCDFSSFSSVDSSVREKYISTLILELLSYKQLPKIRVDTIFFGGGTPSLLTSEEFSEIVKAIHESFEVVDGCEFTVESNPKTIDEKKLSAYLENGVNRLSIGIQSIHENELKYLGRIHNFFDVKEIVNLAHSCGLSNINADIMYSIPEQTQSSFEKTIDEVLSLGITHLSAYGLILEEGTDFWYRRNSLPLPSEDEEAEMYCTVNKKLKDSGFLHYEVSNYALPTYECRHNLKYWQDMEYIGVGLSAHSYFRKVRYANPVTFSEYFVPNIKRSRTVEFIDEGSEAFEYAMMNLRLSKGIDLWEYERKFGKSFLFGRESKLKEFSQLGLSVLTSDRFYFTERGFYLSNTLLSEIL